MFALFTVSGPDPLFRERLRIEGQRSHSSDRRKLRDDFRHKHWLPRYIIARRFWLFAFVLRLLVWALQALHWKCVHWHYGHDSRARFQSHPICSWLVLCLLFSVGKIGEYLINSQLLDTLRYITLRKKEATSSTHQAKGPSKVLWNLSLIHTKESSMWLAVKKNFQPHQYKPNKNPILQLKWMRKW